jgi:hypothetical protein
MRDYASCPTCKGIEPWVCPDSRDHRQHNPTYVIRYAGWGTTKTGPETFDPDKYLQKDGSLGPYKTAKVFKNHTAAHNAAEQDQRYTWGIFPRS